MSDQANKPIATLRFGDISILANLRNNLLESGQVEQAKPLTAMLTKQGWYEGRGLGKNPQVVAHQAHVLKTAGSGPSFRLRKTDRITGNRIEVAKVQEVVDFRCADTLDEDQL